MQGTNKFKYYTDHRLLNTTLKIKEKGRIKRKINTTFHKLDPQKYKTELIKNLGNLNSTCNTNKLYN